jgi:tetratricopeptide (TPR) repeat protein
VPGLVPDETSALGEVERLVQGGSVESAVDVLANVVEQGASIQAICLLASLYLELGQNDQAHGYATLAVGKDPSSGPARDVLAKANLALGDFAAALTDFEAIAGIIREQRQTPPDQFSIPAHFALHNIEQLDHILAQHRDERTFARPLDQELNSVRRGLTDLIDQADGDAPWASFQGAHSRVIADPPYIKVSEERLPRYLNAGVDYGPIKDAIVGGRLQAEVIDDFLTPQALAQVQKFCLESTVWRHPYQFGYVGAFPQDGFASVSLFAIAEELSASLGEVFDDYELAQWWAFVYNTNLPGTDIHGDDADFSLNLWITPDSANLDPDGGGLVVWDKSAPSDWSYNDYNSGGERVKQFLRDENAESHVIPYRANRAVLFKGHLFHRTDDFTFAPGFANRRRSVTFLFRRRKG